MNFKNLMRFIALSNDPVIQKIAKEIGEEFDKDQANNIKWSDGKVVRAFLFDAIAAVEVVSDEFGVTETSDGAKFLRDLLTDPLAPVKAKAFNVSGIADTLRGLIPADADLETITQIVTSQVETKFEFGGILLSILVKLIVEFLTAKK